MKKIALILFIFPVSLFGYGQIHSCITQQEAEKILGQPAHLSMSSSETKDKIIKYRCTYTVNNKEVAAGRESNLYYLFEEYEKAGAAGKSFADILSANAGMPGLYRLNGMGDEAIIQTDSLNFQLIIIRKSDKIIRMKVNKVTGTTSISELKAVAKKITDLL
jgi:hypothetical protein